LTRGVSPAIGRCELSFVERRPIDLARAEAQHARYCEALASLGLELVALPGDARFPDCCFVEDAAVVLDEIAVVTRPEAPSRRGETDAVADALARHRPLVRVAEPATLDGGDVLRLGRRIFVGRTARTNAAGIEALRAAVEPHGYGVTAVEVSGCLHLKSAATALGPDAVLVHSPWIDPAPLRGIELVSVPADEPLAANVLALGRHAVAHVGFPRTLDLLARRGFTVVPVDVSEFLKAEAGVTCKSVVWGWYAAPEVTPEHRRGRRSGLARVRPRRGAAGAAVRAGGRRGGRGALRPCGA
jgi:dimethylargininase